MAINAYPLSWPEGWPRTPAPQRKVARFSRVDQNAIGWAAHSRITIADGVNRCLLALQRFGASRDDIVVSTNVQTRLDGLPRSDAKEPQDPGAAVYWRTRRDKAPRVMAIDIYTRVADNLAAIAATLEAMRAIERHGGAQILERAFTGFTALPDPNRTKGWREVLGIPPGATATIEAVELAYRRLRSVNHPDKGGDATAFQELQRAYEEALAEIG